MQCHRIYLRLGCAMSGAATPYVPMPALRARPARCAASARRHPRVNGVRARLQVRGANRHCRRARNQRSADRKPGETLVESSNPLWLFDPNIEQSQTFTPPRPGDASFGVYAWLALPLGRRRAAGVPEVRRGHHSCRVRAGQGIRFRRNDPHRLCGPNAGLAQRRFE